MLKLLYQNNIGNFHLPNAVSHEKRKFIYETNYGNVVSNHFEKILEIAEIDYEKYLPYEINRHDTYFFVIQPTWYADNTSLKKSLLQIDKKILELVNSGYDIRFLIWFPQEGFKVDTPGLFDDLHEIIYEKDLPNCIFIFGDLNIKQNYKKWLKENNYKEVLWVYGFDIFDLEYYNETEELYNDNYNINEQLVNE